MDRLVRKDFMAGENIRSAGEGFTAASAAYLNDNIKKGASVIEVPFWVVAVPAIMGIQASSADCSYECCPLRS